MNIRPYTHSNDFEIIKNWITDERTNAMWSANHIKFPIERTDFENTLKKFGIGHGDRPFVAVDDSGEVFGFFCYSVNQNTDEGMLKFIMINNQLRGQGCGKKMLEYAVKNAFETSGVKAVQLNVLSANHRAKRCYESVGFAERSKEEGAFTYKDEVWDRINMAIYR